MKYPNNRLRRIRNFNWSRELFAETRVHPSDLIQPYFIVEGSGVKQPIESMSGIYRYSIDTLIDEVKFVKSIGIKAIILFPYLEHSQKSLYGEEAYNPENLICRTIKQLKLKVPDMAVICDVALDPYKVDGHDGITDKSGNVINDETILSLVKQSLVLAKAGCDALAPSDMMDGRVIAIRNMLEEENFFNLHIMAYGAKYASNFYQPFRRAIGSSLAHNNINKSGYQMDYRNIKESITEVKLDVEEGADSIIIKPSLSYLDIINTNAQHSPIPVLGYQVSGEYAMLKIAADNYVFSWKDVILETVTSIKRAGASAVITYAATELAQLLG